MLDDPKVWVLFVCSTLMAALDGLQRPSLDALVPRLVERDELAAAGALGSFRMTIGMVVGPAIGGVLIATVGLPLTYGVDVATFLFSLAMLRMMRAVPPPPERGAAVASPDHGGRALRASRPDLLGTYIVDIIAMFFGMPMALFPAIAEGFGGAGALGPALRRAQRRLAARDRVQRLDGERRRHGRAICLAAAGWGPRIVGFGLAGSTVGSRWCSWPSPAAPT